ncbi:putative permease often clustered with de novo purine synthesis [Rhodovastum atsumiense]|nr:AI-2E family transporter [Rhodovastum atsumiense]CAH2601590.1 putative permease often clustered with de novo purine synthesis [Rhodovastum atsumiense]
MTLPVASPPILAEPPVPGPPPPPSPRGPGTTRLQRLGLLIGLLVAAWLMLQLFASVLLPFVAAAGIAYFLDPPASRLTRGGMPRGGAALLLITALVALGLLFALLLYPLILSQIGLLIGRLPAYVGSIREFATDVMARLQERLGPEYVDEKLRDLVAGQAGTMLSVVASALSRLIGGSFALFNVLSLMLVTPVVAFYLLRDWPRLVAQVDGWLPRRYAGVIRAQAREVDRILSAWLRGQALCCIILAVFYAAGLSAAGLELGLTVGLSAGMLSFIPYVGTITGAVTSIGLACAQFPTWTGVAVVTCVFIAGQLLEGYIIYPRFLGDRVELHAVWVIFALFAGGAAFGFLGVLLAVPVAATIGVLARFWLRRYLNSPLYLEPPARPGHEP